MSTSPDTAVQITKIEEIAGKVIVHLTSTHLNDAQLCMLRYYFSHEKLLRMLATPKALSRGAFMHKILEIYYKLKINPTVKIGGNELVITDHGKKIEYAINEARYYAVTNQVPSEIVTEVLDRLELYFKFYHDDGWIPLAVEIPFSRILYDSPQLMIVYEGRMDLIVENLNGTKLGVDHKSESRKSVPVRILNQFVGYAWAAELDTYVINKVGFQSSIKEPNKLFSRPHLEYTTEMKEEWREDTIFWVLQILNAKHSGYWARNRTSCDKYGRCPFLPICDAESPADRAMVISMNYTVGTPHDPMAEEEED